ncbi:hypothetical protein BT63DRAFT_29080 [Microthyrium microscopicum]|uniref:5'-3' DNA helicase ZGRF1-like N-terminal domain-containing protein n=1 Tax=Microthyrium microscopicum TaxID=703497 RepID=A0A6A6US99_9PEZI|nr:hypothetical protein BT63DRAFT_29080 [Microthyrium microscopicum]
MESSQAAVLEFSCQFTRQVRQKQKKWADGKLKFHCFNKKIVVRDDNGSILGGCHRLDGIVEGDEVSLDNGLLVEVGVFINATQTNLAPLFDRNTQRSQHPAQNQTPRASVIASPLPPTRVGNTNSEFGRPRPSPATKPKHKSLSALLNSTGPIGKARPQVSPFEERNVTAEEEDFEEDEQRNPPVKRRRIEPPSRKEAWTVTALSRPSTSTKPKDTIHPPTRPKKTTLAKKAKPKPRSPGQTTLRRQTMIDLTTPSPNEHEPLQSRVPTRNKASESGPSIRQSLSERIGVGETIVRSSSPPVRASNTVVHVDESLDIIDDDAASAAYELAEAEKIPGARSDASRPFASRNNGSRIAASPDFPSGGAQNREERRKKSLKLVSNKNKRSRLLCMQSENKENTSDQQEDEIEEPPSEAVQHRPRQASGGRSRNNQEHQITPVRRSIGARGGPKSPVIVVDEDDYDSIDDFLATSSPAKPNPRRTAAPIVAPLGQTIVLPAGPSEAPAQASPLRSSLRRIQSESDAASSRNAQGVRPVDQQGPVGAGNTLAAAVGVARTTMAAPRTSNLQDRQNRLNLQRGRTSLTRAQTHAAAITPFRPPMPPVVEPEPTPLDSGPWSREAFDLFDWRPPDWEARMAGVPSTVGMVD